MASSRMDLILLYGLPWARTYARHLGAGRCRRTAACKCTIELWPSTRCVDATTVQTSSQSGQVRYTAQFKVFNILNNFKGSGLAAAQISVRILNTLRSCTLYIHAYAMWSTVHTYKIYTRSNGDEHYLELVRILRAQQRDQFITI